MTSPAFIGYDNYYSTNSEENRHYAYDIYRKLKATARSSAAPSSSCSTQKNRCSCPTASSGAKECPKCGARTNTATPAGVRRHLQPDRAEKPYSAVSGATPVLRESEHFFFRLGECADFLRAWTAGASTLADGRSQAHLQTESLNKMNRWIDGGLQDWDISRDAPYFGFEIPDAPGKYFYVWLDAPIGYMASFKNLCERSGLNFDDYFKADSTAELYHFHRQRTSCISTRCSGQPPCNILATAPDRVFAHGF